MHVEQIGADQQRAGLGKVRVVVDEAGRDESSGRVDDPSAGGAVGVDLRVRAHGDEPLTADRDGLGAGLRGVAGPDAGVADDEVGGRSAPGGLRGRGDGPGEQQEGESRGDAVHERKTTTEN
jgi:hypothetical protein